MLRSQAVDLASKIGALLRSEYVFAEVAEQISLRIRRNAETGGYDAITDAAELGRILTRDLRMVNNDKHLLVEPTIPSRRDSSQAQHDRRLSLMREHNFGFRTIKMLNSNIGYLEIEALIDPTFDGASEAAVEAMARLSKVCAAGAKKRTVADPPIIRWGVR